MAAKEEKGKEKKQSSGMLYRIKEKPEDFIVEEIASHTASGYGIYCLCRLTKRDYTTEKAIRHIADALRIRQKDIGYAGIKDRKAITSQYISIKAARQRIERLRFKDLRVEFISMTDSPVSLGDLSGNRFEIVVRDARKQPKMIRKFINLFGEQRFSSNNAETGKAIIKGDFKKASDLLARKGFGVREYLKQHPADYVGAVRRVPFRILKLIVHSYQSYLWNRMALRYKDHCIEGKQGEIPLIGFGTDIGEEERDILKKEGIRQRDFINRQIHDLSVEGDKRELYALVNELKIDKISERTYRISFWLEKGSYATVAINQMFEGSS